MYRYNTALFHWYQLFTESDSAYKLGMAVKIAFMCDGKSYEATESDV